MDSTLPNTIGNNVAEVCGWASSKAVSHYRFLDLLYHSHLLPKAKEQADQLWQKAPMAQESQWPRALQERMQLFHYQSQRF